MMTDPIADLLTRLRNALRNDRLEVVVPRTNMNEGILEVLEREGFIRGYEEVEREDDPQGSVRVDLKYGPEGEDIIRHLQRVSKPGRRIYTKAGDLVPTRGGTGIQILTTSTGILSDREARSQNVGGEILCEVW